MAAVARNREIKAIEAFLASEKRLVGPYPIWNPSSRRGELQATWSIAESFGEERSHLRFRVLQMIGSIRAYLSFSGTIRSGG
jgi:hypothetical protein